MRYFWIAVLGLVLLSCESDKDAQTSTPAVTPPVALAAPPGCLPIGDQPITLINALAIIETRNQIGIGGAGFSDRLDQSVRNSASAALLARSPSDGVRR